MMSAALNSSHRQQGRHHRALGIMEEVAVAQDVVAARRRTEAAAGFLDQIFDDRTGLGDDARVPLPARRAAILDHRRLSERMDGAQLRRREHRLRIATVAADLVIEAQLLEQPEDALRARMFEMVDGDHADPLSQLLRAGNTELVPRPRVHRPSTSPAQKVESRA
jgi:hypothetical protein